MVINILGVKLTQCEIKQRVKQIDSNDELYVLSPTKGSLFLLFNNYKPVFEQYVSVCANSKE